MALFCMFQAAPKAVPILGPRHSPSSARSVAAASCMTARHAQYRRAMPLLPASPRKSNAASNRARWSMLKHDYLRDGAAIYERSFAIIRAEADLARFSAEEAEIAVRMIHACGQVEAAGFIEFSPGLVAAARGAL